jgi:hypothetical protein
MQPNNIVRLLRALARQGLDVQYNDSLSAAFCLTPLASRCAPRFSFRAIGALASLNKALNDACYVVAAIAVGDRSLVNIHNSN